MMTMTATPKIELKPIDWLIPYPRNVKLHPTEQIDRLAATIKRFGWDQPIVAEKDGTIIKGHGRRLAAMKLGMTEVPVWVRDDLTKEEADAARIADNAAFGMQYDTRAMQEELSRLMTDDATFTLDDLALTEKEQTLLTELLDKTNTDAVMKDTIAEIQAAKTEEQRQIDASDNELVSLAKAIGFSKIARSEERVLVEFLAEAEAATGKTGREAFIEALALVNKKGF
jgi:ParB-like chromosome segregation protein Spo0J